jgi:hypothetical protein
MGGEERHEPMTMFQKIWDRHVVVPETPATPAVLYIDLHLVHEVTSPQAFAALDARELSVRRPALACCRLPIRPRRGRSPASRPTVTGTGFASSAVVIPARESCTSWRPSRV